MAETQTPEAAQQPQIKNRIIAQFVRDMSFENILAQKGVKGDPQPEMGVKVRDDDKWPSPITIKTAKPMINQDGNSGLIVAAPLPILWRGRPMVIC